MSFHFPNQMSSVPSTYVAGPSQQFLHFFSKTHLCLINYFAIAKLITALQTKLNFKEIHMLPHSFIGDEIFYPSTCYLFLLIV